MTDLPESDVVISAGMLADRLRPLVLAGKKACLKEGEMIPLHRGTVSAIYQHLERMLLRSTALVGLRPEPVPVSAIRRPSHFAGHAFNSIGQDNELRSMASGADRFL